MSDNVASTITSVPFRDPRPSPERINQLAQRVLAGDILLPRFQRNFVWKRSQILDLLDSVRRNYPIGSLLLWQSRQKLASERNIADLAIAESRPDYPVNYLLDGQQRLSTICGALFWSGTKADSVWNIAYDLKAEKFLHLDTLDTPALHVVPTRFLASPSDYFSRLVGLEKSLSVRAKALFDRFTDYQTAVVTLGDMSIKDVGPVFERINSTGTRLTVVDLMRAATWSPDFDLVEKIDSILADLEPKKFSGIDRKTILRSVAASAGLGFTSENMDSLRDLKAEDLNNAVSSTSQAARRSADFLSTQIGVPSDAAIPYTNQFAVLTEIFRRVPSPTEAQYKEIARWFWLTTFSSYFGGWNTGNMATDFDAVADFAKGGTSIDNGSVAPQASVWRIREFRSNSATSKMLALMLAHEGPVDLLTGQKIDTGKSLAWSNDKEYHHLFPKAYVARSEKWSKPNKVANIIMLSSISNIKIRDKAPSGYLGALREQIGDKPFYNRLSKSLVSREAADAALVDDFDTFLRIRAEDLQSRAVELARISGPAVTPAGDTDVADDLDSDTSD
ncbi:DUF262 domain-containing protein [Actinokineospora terrae]|uniref:GmrSD restriction endonucleases N-terminal domain-containing protein n=1 Tax=Actinokineospora terrae TaxID=155974 RepID=A0A1H9RWN2_9PSEU|nr:DUF262 domain-containing protein [Actinokineospora terrae]SER76309.1 hypothetical protein SAMN04487818_10597 [Actinokineospora terrae]